MAGPQGGGMPDSPLNSSAAHPLAGHALAVSPVAVIAFALMSSIRVSASGVGGR
jgi:hypothetical protein